MGAKIVSLEPYSVADIWKDILRVAEACDCSGRGEELVESLQSELILIHNFAHRSSWQPRVAALEWLEPLMCAGNWMPELIAMANAVPVFGSAGKHSPYLSWEDLVEADPDVIISMPCGFDIARTRTEMRWLTSRPEWQRLKAVRTGQVYLCDGNQYMAARSTHLESLQILCLKFYITSFFPHRLKVRVGSGWKPSSRRRRQRTNRCPFTCNVAAAREFFLCVRTCPDVMQRFIAALDSWLGSVRDHSSAAASGPIARLVIRALKCMTGARVDFYVDGFAGRRKLVQRSNLRMQEFASNLLFPRSQ